MLVVDAQVHIWPANTPEQPWPPLRKSHKNRPSFSKDELLREMDAAGVTRAVLVPPSWQGDSNDLVLEAARLHPDRFAVMGRLAVDRPENAVVVPTVKQAGMAGLRLTVSSGQLAGLDWLWSAAERADVPLMINARASVMSTVKAIAGKYPGLKLAIDHFGVEGGKKDDAAFAFMPQLLEGAACPNISVKVSALPCCSTENYPYRGLHKYVKQVYDAYGPERMFWGSDLSRLPCTYRQAVTVFTEEMPWLTTADKELIMGKAVCRWMGWKLPSEG